MTGRTNAWSRAERARLSDSVASIPVRVHDRTQIGEARRAALALSAQLGLTEQERANVAIVVTEVAANLAIHGREGLVLLRSLGGVGAPGLEVVAVDRGPGIRDVPRALADGYSTAGTSGHGLGAIQRIASEFDIFSSVDSGTALVARIWSGAGSTARTARTLLVGAVCVPVTGEIACGDGWLVCDDARATLVMVVDGLGHGADAAFAASEAARIVREHPSAPPAEIVQAAHGALRATRGAALAVATIDRESPLVRYAGVGNISASIVSDGGVRNLASHNGIVGHQMHKVQEFTYPWPTRATLVMHSDGLSARWRLDAYPGLVLRDPALIAGVLFRDFARGRDDATTVAVRDARPRGAE